MKFDTQTVADCAAQKLDSLLERAARDTAEAIEQADIPQAAAYFAELRDTVKDLAAKTSALQKHLDQLSQELIPTLFTNQNIKTITIPGVGRVTVNVKWSASMLNKEAGLQWLRSTGNDGLIQETVHPQTLGAFAKEETMTGKPLPQDIFKTSTMKFVSIT